MAERIRFHFDENVDSAIAQQLRRRGVDVTTTVDAELLTAPDDVQLAHATSERRVLVTHDDDFLALHARGVQHAGIAFCAAQSRSIGEVVRALELICDVLVPDAMRNHVEFL